MTSLKLTVADAATAELLQPDILSTVYQKLAEFDYRPSTAVTADGDANVHHLQPHGTVWTEQIGNVVEIKLRNVTLDKKDLFTAVLADLEQRNDGVTGEID
ncbi:MAG: hypothetical protein AB1925_13740 [Actinomycetota bacterium]